ncbi:MULTISPECIES: YicC/YloC family endoribonuclease [Thalassolituus]|uniref:YicC/YloC family endoribonuclease n=2 Tax=Oceanospirillaceae TaxID=135620 RepID=UPI000C44088F|nr:MULTISPECIES: YicC/YloC family endoribonuclease [Thalassolituus]MAX86207.1 YicC family protein [Oceanospirillaceae bacterium]
MALSMTAFSRSTIDTDSGRITWEIRSVNSRYLELHFRLPDEFRDMEPALRECIKSRLNRGKVEVFLRFQPSQKQQNLQVNQDLVASLNDAADKVHEVIGPGNALDALKILQWPGVLESTTTDLKALQKSALGSFNECLESLIIARKREGASLKELIQQRCDEARNLSEQADKIIPEALAAQRTHLLNKLNELIENPDTERLEQEMVLLAQKADIAEETDRLRTHIDEVLDILQREEPIGRRLDFMMQELNREANTLSSKAMRTELTSIAVDLKVLIEQMREQVQNIE